MNLTYIQRNSVARARVKIEAAQKLLAEAETILKPLCDIGKIVNVDVEEFEKFFNLIPSGTPSHDEMKSHLFQLKISVVDKVGVHTSHCCSIHGCKYCEDETCPVVQGEAEQEYPCEDCDRCS